LQDFTGYDEMIVQPPQPTAGTMGCR
jgi:hypothetical protein